MGECLVVVERWYWLTLLLNKPVAHMICSFVAGMVRVDGNTASWPDNSL